MPDTANMSNVANTSSEDAGSSDERRVALAACVLIALSGTLALLDEALGGTAQTVARALLVPGIVVAAAWCGSLFRTRRPGAGRWD